MTRILKEYGDVLEKYQLAPDKADIGRELRVLRCLLLLIKLTGCSQAPPCKMCLLGFCVRDPCHTGLRLFAMQSDMAHSKTQTEEKDPECRQLILPS